MGHDFLGGMCSSPAQPLGLQALPLPSILWLILLALAEELSGWKAIWRKTVVSGVAPCPRSGHTFTAISPCKAVVFGGVGAGSSASALLNDMHVLDTGTWYACQPRVLVAGMCPPSGRCV